MSNKYSKASNIKRSKSQNFKIPRFQDSEIPKKKPSKTTTTFSSFPNMEFKRYESKMQRNSYTELSGYSLLDFYGTNKNDQNM